MVELVERALKLLEKKELKQLKRLKNKVKCKIWKIKKRGIKDADK